MAKKQIAIHKSLSNGYIVSSKLSQFQIKIFYLCLKELIYLNSFDKGKELILKNKNINQFDFKVTDFCKELNISPQNFYNRFDQSSDVLQNIKIEFKTQDKKDTEKYVVIPTIIIKEGVVSIGFNPNCLQYVLPYNKEYDLNDLTFLLGNDLVHTKTLFIRLRSYQNPFQFNCLEISFTEIKKMFFINENNLYSQWTHFNNRIWKRVTKELKNTEEFKNIKIIYKKINKKIEIIKFMIPPYKTEKKPTPQLETRDLYKTSTNDDWEL